MLARLQRSSVTHSAAQALNVNRSVHFSVLVKPCQSTIHKQPFRLQQSVTATNGIFSQIPSAALVAQTQVRAMGCQHRSLKYKGKIKHKFTLRKRMTDAQRIEAKRRMKELEERRAASKSFQWPARTETESIYQKFILAFRGVGTSPTLKTLHRMLNTVQSERDMCMATKIFMNFRVRNMITTPTTTSLVFKNFMNYDQTDTILLTLNNNDNFKLAYSKDLLRNIMTYFTVKHDMPEKAAELFSSIRKGKLGAQHQEHPDPELYSVYIAHLLRKGNAEEATSLLTEKSADGNSNAFSDDFVLGVAALINHSDKSLLQALVPIVKDILTGDKQAALEELMNKSQQESA